MPVVSLEAVSKKYRTLSSRRSQLKQALSFGKGKADGGFWALRDINLEVERGTTLGILGRNGAGKSTLLKLISGVLQPTSGTVRVNGRMVALLQLGAGFNNEFTGRENVMLNGLILGIERKEMLERFDEIAAFAEIDEFMDQPIKTYSGGMRSRLGFAVAVNVRPDILIVDEALSAGDAVFKAKGIQRMRELQESGVTVLFVSHSTAQVKDFCTEAALLHKGELLSHGDLDQVIDHYETLLSNATEQRNDQLGPDQPPVFKVNPALDKRGLSLGAEDASIQNVELLDDLGGQVDAVTPESNLTVRVHVQYMKPVDDSVVHIILRNEVGLDVFSTSTALEDTPIGERRAGERVIVDFAFQVPLRHGRYSVAAAVSHPGSKDLPLDWIIATVFKVSRSSERGRFPGLVHLPTQINVLEPDRVRVFKRKPPG